MTRRRGHRRKNSKRLFWLLDIWSRFRPYSIALSVDFLISASLWSCLYVFQKLTKALIIDGWEGKIVLTVHAINIAVALGTFGVLFTLDVIAIRKNEHSGF